jgi:hypothetical protein
MDAKCKAHSKSCAHHKTPSRSRSNLHVPEAYKKEVITKDLDERSTDPITSLMNRFGSLFQRRGSHNNSKTPDTKQSPLSQSSNSICHISSKTECSASGEFTENFDKVRRELMTLKKFREGCE